MEFNQVEHLKQITKKAGPRYTAKLNVELPISEIFDGISRTEAFYKDIRIHYGKLLRSFKSLKAQYEDKNIQDKYNIAKEELRLLLEILQTIKEYDTIIIQWEKINKDTETIQESLWKLLEQLREAKNKFIEEKQSTNKVQNDYYRYTSTPFDSDISNIYKTIEIIRYFDDLSSSPKAKLSNKPFLLITGEAGIGKTHLLCDITEHRIQEEESKLAFLMFGEDFRESEDIWVQIFKQLKSPDFDKETFLSMVDEHSQIKKCRALIMIDALNESRGDFWKQHIPTLVEDIKKYPNIALLLSIRSGFENHVLPTEQQQNFIHEEHYGFELREWEAIQKFFNEFSLPLLEIPPLMPEFQNPLFLLLFCKAFTQRTRQPERQIFRGHEGSTYIFENFVDSVSKNIETDYGIDHGPNKNIWDTIIEKIAKEMVEQNTDRISKEKCIEIIQNAHPTIDASALMTTLEQNMLITKVPRYLEDSYDIRFPFQKFSDHLIGRYIFKKYEYIVGRGNKNIQTAKKFFSKKKKLGKFLSYSGNIGIIEALSIQCPEWLKGIEFVEVAPYLLKTSYPDAKTAFIKSIIWRKPTAFSEDKKNVFNIMNRYIITKYHSDQLLDAFLSIASVPEHPFNANFLHKHLSKFSMPERDARWSVFLHKEYGNRGSVDRLLHWAWSDANKAHLSDESVFLTSVTLSWFLTTSNRFVRDKATKGLVCLLQNRLYLLLKLLKLFHNIDEPYIYERLYAVTYGCVLRNHDDINNIEILSKWVYENIFKDNMPPKHILLRDYARGIIEIAIQRGIKLKINEENINPPYNSKWPKYIPSEEKLKKKYDSKEKGLSDIWFSIMSGGDFSRYVLGTNYISNEWSNQRIGQKVVTKQELLEKFKSGLTSKQKEAWDKTYPPIKKQNAQDIIMSKFLENLSDEELEELKRQLEKKAKKKEKNTVKKFKETLSKRKLNHFEKKLEPFINSNGEIKKERAESFDLNIAQRWIFHRVIKLGYNPKLHGQFDSNIRDNGRSEHKAERIGKKYQWIAYYEFMALLSDNFEFKGNSWNKSVEKYKGPWNPYLRDIDPSFIIQNDNHIRESITFSKWKQINYNTLNDNLSGNIANWIEANEDLPKPENIIQITDDKEKEWLMLSGFVKWQEQTPPEYEKYDIPVNELQYSIKSYIIKKNAIQQFLDWAKSQDLMRMQRLGSYKFYEAFLGEYPNSMAFEDLRNDYNIWINPETDSENSPISIAITDDSYLNEFTLDCSHEGSITIQIPSKLLIDTMNLNHRDLDGRFFDKDNNLIALPTEIYEDTMPSALLINKSHLIKFLDQNEYGILWLLSGEKLSIGGHLSGNRRIGRLEISGIYTLNQETICGDMQSNYNEN